MTRVFMREKKNGTLFECLEAGDCFPDKDDLFCIKVNSTTYLVVDDDLINWDVYKECNASEEVFPVDVEIHIVS